MKLKLFTPISLPSYPKQPGQSLQLSEASDITHSNTGPGTLDFRQVNALLKMVFVVHYMICPQSFLLSDSTVSHRLQSKHLHPISSGLVTCSVGWDVSGCTVRRSLSGFSLVAWASAICHEAAVPELETGGANLNTVLSLKQGCHLVYKQGRRAQRH